MQRLRSSFTKPLAQIITILGVSFLFYIFATRSGGEIQHFQIKDQFAYLANESAGVRVVDISDPENMAEVGFFRCALPYAPTERDRFNYNLCIGSANALEIQDDNLFATDARSALWWLDLSENPARPTLTSQAELPGRPQDLVVVGDYVYVASGNAGVRIVKVTQKETDSTEGEQEQTGGKLDDLEYEPLASAGNAQKIFSNGDRLYWTDNRRTLHVVNISNREQPKEISQQKLKYQINDLVFLGSYALAAAGEEGLIIYEIGESSELTQITQLNTGGATQGVFLTGNYAYLVDQNDGIVVVDITYVTQPRIVEKNAPISGRPTQVIVSGDFAYVANGIDGLYSYEASVKIESDYLGRSGAPLLAYNVVKAGNYAYVAAGERGLSVVDISIPGAPNEVAFFDTAGRADSVAVGGDVAYIADRTNGVVVVDLTNRSGSLDQIMQIDSQDARDIAIAGNYAYLADYQDGLIILDISQPTATRIVKVMDPPNGQVIPPTGMTVLGDFAYLASGSEGVQVVNVYDKNIPTLVQQIKIPGQSDARNMAVVAFNPQAQDPFSPNLNDPATRVYAYVANGNFGLQLFDVTNPNQQVPVQIPLDPQILGLQGIAMDVAISRDRTYLAYDGAGVYILDTSNPAQPKYVGFISLAQTENRVVALTAESAQVYLAALEHGLQIIDASNVTTPVVVSQFAAPASVRNMAVAGQYAYTVDGSRGLWIFDVTDPEHPQGLQFLSIPEASGVFVDDNFAYVAAGSFGLKIVNIANKTQPFLQASLDTAGFAQSVIVSERFSNNTSYKYAYIADSAEGLVIVDVKDPTLPVRVGGLGQIGLASRLAENPTDYLYIAANQDGLAAVNVVDVANPALMDVEKVTPLTRGVAIVAGSYAYTAAGPDGMVILEIAYPLSMSPLEYREPADDGWIENVSVSITSPISGTITDTLTIPPNYAFLADRIQGVRILETTNPASPARRGEWEVTNALQESGTQQTTPEVLQIVALWIPPQKDDTKPGTFGIFVVDGTHGFFILEGTKETAIKNLDVFETSGTPSASTLVSYLRAKFSGEPYPSEKASTLARQLLLDVLLFGLVGIFLWTGFLALVLLPVDSFSDWQNLYNRLIYFLFDRHGPLLRLKDGQVVTRQTSGGVQEPVEAQRYGPGVILVDVNSAPVLEKRNMARSQRINLPIARVANPGVVYTGNRVILTQPRFDEIVRGVADLRSQFRIATGVNGHTRDVIEIETTIWTIFTLGETPDVLRVAYYPSGDVPTDQEQPQAYQPQAADLRVIVLKQENNGRWMIDSIRDELDESDKREIHQFALSLSNQDFHRFTEEDELALRQSTENGAPFIRDPVRIFQAVYAQAEDLPEDKQLDWTELPLMIVTEKFRNMLAEEVYDQLFQPLHPTDYPGRLLRDNLRRWARNQGVLSYQFVRLADGSFPKEKVPINPGSLQASLVRGLNNPKILRTRGIKVKVAGFGELRPTNSAVRKQFLDFWQAQREKDAAFIRSDFELRKLRERNEWRKEAQQEILEEFTEILAAGRYADEALAIHVLQALEGAAIDPEISQLLPENTVEMLRNLRNWLLNMPDFRIGP